MSFFIPKIKYCVLLLLGAMACSDDSSSIPPLETGPHSGDSRSAADITLGDPVPISLATYNVENFFDAVDDPDHDDDLPSESQVRSKIIALGQAIRALDVDILAIQEIENKGVLERLNTEQLGDLNYQHLRLIKGNDFRGQNVAILSRFPIKTAISHASDRFTGVEGDSTTYGFSRDCLEVALEPSPGRQLVLLINHLAAKSTTTAQEADNRRLAQANRVREIVDQLLEKDPQINLAVMGDMNETPDSKTLQLMRIGPPTLTDVLDSANGDRYTFVYKGEEQQIDYIMLAPGLTADLIKNSATVVYGTSFKEASDHFPVTAKIILE